MQGEGLPRAAGFKKMINAFHLIEGPYSINFTFLVLRGSSSRDCTDDVCIVHLTSFPSERDIYVARAAVVISCAPRKSDKRYLLSRDHFGKHARATDMIYDICIIPHGGLVEKLAEKAQEAGCDRFAMQCTSRDQIFKAPHTTACRSSIRATKRDIDHGVRNHLSDLRFQVHANPPPREFGSS